MDFNEISKIYKETSIVQASAGEILQEILGIKENENVLDIGCGTGNITHDLRQKSTGRIVGIDPSEGMIQKAKENYEKENIEFYVLDGESINETLGVFDVAFCNSAFQWFKKPEIILKNIYSVLGKNGRIGIQAPATYNYCPNFVGSIEKIQENNLTKDIFKYFKSPWFFLETAEDYELLFKKAGYQIKFSKIEKTISHVTPDTAFKIFSSGAIAGYLDESNYSCPVDEKYKENFKEIIKTSFTNQAVEGKVEVVFNRIFIIGEKV